MAQIAGHGGRSQESQKFDLNCVLLALVGAAGVALFGYILVMCVGMEHIDPRPVIERLVETFRH